MTHPMSTDLRRIAEDVLRSPLFGPSHSAKILEAAAELDARAWRSVATDPPPLGEYVLIWVPSRPWISKSPTVFAKTARRIAHPRTDSGFTWEGFGPDNYSDSEVAAWQPITTPPEQTR